MPHFLLLIALDGAGHGGLVASFIEMLGFFVGKVPSRHSEYQKKIICEGEELTYKYYW